MKLSFFLCIIFIFCYINSREKKKVAVLLGLEESYTAHVVHDC